MIRPRRIFLWLLIACFWGLQVLGPSNSLAAGCGACGGSGTSRLACSFCKGTGKNGGFKCSFCNGRMFGKCFSCNGTGQDAPAHRRRHRCAPPVKARGPQTSPAPSAKAPARTETSSVRFATGRCFPSVTAATVRADGPSGAAQARRHGAVWLRQNSGRGPFSVLERA